MKLECLIFVLFLISSVLNESISKYNTMYANNRKTFTGLRNNQKYYFTITASIKHKYTIKIEISRDNISSYHSFFYIVHSSSIPSSTENESTLSISKYYTTDLYYIYEFSEITATKDFLSLALIPKYNYGSVSITISEPGSGTTSIGFGIIFLIVFFSILGFYIIILTVIGCIKKRSKRKNDSKIESTPQPDNYTPLIPQSQ